jgi:hypothetical protein
VPAHGAERDLEAGLHGPADPAAVTTGTRDLGPRWAFTELVRPLPLLAVAVLAVNDAFLKPAFHNALTGKLSDLAGCFLFPLYLAALLALVAPRLTLRTRLLAGCGATVGLFAALELSPAAVAGFCRVNEVVADVLGIHRPCRLTADLTDLLTLIMVPLAYLYGMRSARLREPSTIPSS